MPCLNLSTNVNLEKIDTSAVLSEASKAVARVTGKPEQYVMIVLEGSIPVSFGGSQDPAAFGTLVSIGGLNSDVNKELSAAIAAILETKLSIPKSRFYLKFEDTKGDEISLDTFNKYVSKGGVLFSGHLGRTLENNRGHL